MINAIIDLSHHNANPDFAIAAGAGILGVIHKASQGLGSIDPTYAAREPDARAAGILWGAYHFGTNADGVAQADHLLAQIHDPATTLLVLDFEPNGEDDTMTLAQAKAFVKRVADKTGGFPVLYSGSLIKQTLGDHSDPLLAQCPFWLAQYGPRAVVPKCWPTWTFWQYTDGAVGDLPHDVPGIGKCDRDWFNGDEAHLRMLWPH